jgi:hypothetical protein
VDTQSQTPTHSSAKSGIKVGVSPLPIRVEGGDLGATRVDLPSEQVVANDCRDRRCFVQRFLGQTVARPSRSGLFSNPERDALATFAGSRVGPRLG